VALDRFGGRQESTPKGRRGDVVTAADVEVERLVHGLLAAEFPDHAILSEETAPHTEPSHGWVWVLDPIDGTKNYSLGIPFWCVNLALLHDGEPQLGITYDAVRDEEFRATAGGGAWCGEARLRASSSPDVRSSVLGMDLGYDDALGARQIALMGTIFPHVQTIRILGSAALAFAYAAAGRLDMFTHTNVAAWDIAAGMLLVQEAGGLALDRDGSPIRITSTAFAAGGVRVVEDFMRTYVQALS